MLGHGGAIRRSSVGLNDLCGRGVVFADDHGAGVGGDGDARVLLVEVRLVGWSPWLRTVWGL